MKSMRLEELQELALATGGQLKVGGKTFNSAQAQIAKTRTRPAQEAVSEPVAAPVTAAAIADPTFTRADVEQMLAEQEARLMQVMLTSLAQAHQQQDVDPDPGLVPTGFTPQYDRAGAITFVGVKYERLQ